MIENLNIKFFKYIYMCSNYYFINLNIIKLNFKNFNVFFQFFKKPIIMPINSIFLKYSWLKNIEVNGVIFSFFLNNNNNFYYKKNIEKIVNLDNLIKFKKKTSLFKKVFDINFVILNKISEYTSQFDLNIFNKNFDSNTYNDFLDDNISLKNIDLKKKIKLLFNVNRKIAKKIFSIKKNKQHALTKKLKHICNLKKTDTVRILENSLANIVISSDFFFSENDLKWFLSNGLISVNSKKIKTFNFFLKPLDIVQISVNNYYYKYYNYLFNFLIFNIPKINKKLWLINKNRYENIYYRDIKTKIVNENFLSIFENYKFFKKEIPLHLEIDYVTMTIIIIKTNTNVNFFNYYNFKFFNFNLNRLYNWKFIT